jgi:hypothetical protein
MPILEPVLPFDHVIVPPVQPLAVKTASPILVALALIIGVADGVVQPGSITLGTVIVTVVVEQFVASVLSHILYVNVSVPEKSAFGV